MEDLNSIGQFYQSVTRYLGFRVNRHKGKITGLAAFGDYSQTFKLMNSIYSFSRGELKAFFQDNEELKLSPVFYFKKYIKDKDFITEDYVRSLNGQLKNFAVGYQFYINFLRDSIKKFEPKDVAAGIQKLAEESIVKNGSLWIMFVLALSTPMRK